MRLKNQEFHLLDSYRNRLILIVSCFLFSVLFLYFFVPFNINSWFKETAFEQILRYCEYSAVGAGVLLFTQFPVRMALKKNSFTIASFAAWILVEVILMTVAATFIFSFKNPGFKDFIHTFKYALLGMIIPYSIVLLILSIIQYQFEVRKLRSEKESSGKPELILFHDEYGKLRFSISPKDLLYLESSDNYVSVYFLSGGNLKRHLLRNNLKNIQSSLQGKFRVERCHRSFMVNVRNIIYAQKSGSTFKLKLKNAEEFIPVSRKFIPDFEKYLQP